MVGVTVGTIQKENWKLLFKKVFFYGYSTFQEGRQKQLHQ
jgi:hypothetical protein